MLHDIDFLKTKHDGPAQHGKLAANMLSAAPEAIKMAIAAHNGEYTGVIPFSKLDFTLRGGKIVTGMISAAALVRTEDVKGMQPNSLKKKIKDKAFVATVTAKPSKNARNQTGTRRLSHPIHLGHGRCAAKSC